MPDHRAAKESFVRADATTVFDGPLEQEWVPSGISSSGS